MSSIYRQRIWQKVDGKLNSRALSREVEVMVVVNSLECTSTTTTPNASATEYMLHEIDQGSGGEGDGCEVFGLHHHHHYLCEACTLLGA